jgi:GMP synthase (glutamine-hydrolysing)
VRLQYSLLGKPVISILLRLIEIGWMPVGSGLGVCILREVKQEYADILRLADAIFMEELHASGWYQKTSQAFVVFLPVKSVGVVGDGRRYEWVVSLRAVETIDFMTARWAHLPYELLEKSRDELLMK